MLIIGVKMMAVSAAVSFFGCNVVTKSKTLMLFLEGLFNAGLFLTAIGLVI